MSYLLHLHGPMRWPKGSNMPKLWHPGPYIVPEQMPEEIADHAMKNGQATKHGKEPVPGVEDPELAAKVEEEFQATQDGSKRQRDRRKGPAPENKALDEAGDNQAALEK